MRAINALICGLIGCAVAESHDQHTQNTKMVNRKLLSVGLPLYYTDHQGRPTLVALRPDAKVYDLRRAVERNGLKCRISHAGQSLRDDNALLADLGVSAEAMVNIEYWNPEIQITKDVTREYSIGEGGCLRWQIPGDWQEFYVEDGQLMFYVANKQIELQVAEDGIYQISFRKTKVDGRDCIAIEINGRPFNDYLIPCSDQDVQFGVIVAYE